MIQEIEEIHFNDANDNPCGGTTTAVGLSINWQEGPLQQGSERLEPNGTFVETVILAAIGRLNYYQDSKFQCVENAIALANLQNALSILQIRTKDRERRGVEGTHQA